MLHKISSLVSHNHVKRNIIAQPPEVKRIRNRGKKTNLSVSLYFHSSFCLFVCLINNGQDKLGKFGPSGLYHYCIGPTGLSPPLRWRYRGKNFNFFMSVYFRNKAWWIVRTQLAHRVKVLDIQNMSDFFRLATITLQEGRGQ